MAGGAHRAALPIPQMKRHLNHLGLRWRALDGTDQQTVGPAPPLAGRAPSQSRTSAASWRSSPPPKAAGHRRGGPAQRQTWSQPCGEWTLARPCGDAYEDAARGPFRYDSRRPPAGSAADEAVWNGPADQPPSRRLRPVGGSKGPRARRSSCRWVPTRPRRASKSIWTRRRLARHSLRRPAGTDRLAGRWNHRRVEPSGKHARPIHAIIRLMPDLEVRRDRLESDPEQAGSHQRCASLRFRGRRLAAASHGVARRLALSHQGKGEDVVDGCEGVSVLRGVVHNVCFRGGRRRTDPCWP